MSDKPVKKPFALKGIKGVKTNISKTDEEMSAIFDVPQSELQTDITATVPMPSSGLFRRLDKAQPTTMVQKKADIPKKITQLTKAVAASQTIKPTQEVTFPTLESKIMQAQQAQVIQPTAPQASEFVSALPEETHPYQDSLEPSKEFTQPVDPGLRAQQELVEDYVTRDTYSIAETDNHYIPESSRDFRRFINTTFSSFTLPPRLGEIDWDACSKRSETVDMYNYQKFVREYMRQASPYRGVLVYHGLGSGKTCTSIAAAEALYGSTNKRIIVMTPIALKKNFITELGFCGFRHYRVKENYWVPYNFKTDLLARAFATEVVGIPNSYLSWLEKARQLTDKLPITDSDRVFFMPDFSKTAEQSNYASLTPLQQGLLERQIRETIENKIEFIGYTGISKDKLKQMAVGTYKGKIPLRQGQKFFDDAIIIIDEVHNLTRLISGDLDSYLKDTSEEILQPGKKPRKRLVTYEPIETTPWAPKLASSPKPYDRSYLFYRLLTEARNSKIIALSGTPIVNVPDEIGILGNILHGYFHSAECSIESVASEIIQQIKKDLDKHPRIEYVDIQPATNVTKLFITRLEEGYIRTFDETGKYLGVTYVGDAATPNTIEEIFMDVDAIVRKYKVRLSTGTAGVKFKAIPLFPPFYDEFNKYFVDINNAKMINKNLFKKRISGLISYYKGAKEELMPIVNPGDDKVVYVEMSRYALPYYTQAREKERGETSGSSSNAFAEGATLGADEAKATSYRFNSRSVCNFVFPETIKRPFPKDAAEFKKAAGVDDTIIADAVTAVVPTLTEQEEQEQEKILEEDQIQEQPPQPSVKTERSYEERIQEALMLLRAEAMSVADPNKKRFQMTDDVAEEFRLSTYSPKFKAMIENIESIAGSSLIYSQFRTLEGIGIFSIILDSLGYQRIEIRGSKMESLEFTEQTVQSFIDPALRDAPRYIIYSGEETTDIRQTLINVFNVRGYLPEKIKSVMESSGLMGTKNLGAEICKIFMITGAGAEGLSLRAVRAVHIMEPYWNKVRTDQVKGRAIRICSHEDFKNKEDRSVKIFTYITKFSEHMISERMIDYTITQLDNNKTSDEHVQMVSDVKDQVGKEFLQCLKESAVDCVLNESENENIQCYIVEGDPTSALYDPRIAVDKGRTPETVDTAVAPLRVLPITTAQAESLPPQVQPQQTVQYRAFKNKEGKIFIKVPRTDKATGKAYIGIYAIQDKAVLRTELGMVKVSPEGKEEIVMYPTPKIMV